MIGSSVYGQGGDGSRLGEWLVISPERNDRNPALSYIVEFGIYLKENGKLLKDAM